jgi:hypothetical protein
MTDAVRESVDFAIVTALEEEQNAIHALPDLRRAPPIAEDARVYYRSDLPVILSNGQPRMYRAATLSLTGIGRVNGATATADAAQYPTVSVVWNATRS